MNLPGELGHDLNRAKVSLNQALTTRTAEKSETEKDDRDDSDDSDDSCARVAAHGFVPKEVVPGMEQAPDSALRSEPK